MQDILAPYWIVAGCVLSAGCVVIVAAFSGLVCKITKNQPNIVDVRIEDPWQNTEMILYFFTVMGMFFCATSMGTVFTSFFYIYGMCR
jgi:hypothetical protein